MMHVIMHYEAFIFVRPINTFVYRCALEYINFMDLGIQR